MRRYFVKTPFFLPWFQPAGLLWKGPASEGIYLTFDDGPEPNVTPRVLDLLKAHDARATFFCVGENAQRHPEIVARLLEEGHALGNHTHNHLRGWDAATEAYVANVLQATPYLPTGWFRPPYGRIRPAQAKALQRQGFRIVMWDVLGADFDPELSADACANHVLHHARPGSLVVLHDSRKAADRCLPALEKILSHYNARGVPLLALPACPLPHALQP